MMPAFDIDGGLGLALVRSLSVAALLSVFGTLAFQVFVMPRTKASVVPEGWLRAPTSPAHRTVCALRATRSIRSPMANWKSATCRPRVPLNGALLRSSALCRASPGFGAAATPR